MHDFLYFVCRFCLKVKLLILDFNAVITVCKAFHFVHQVATCPNPDCCELVSHSGFTGTDSTENMLSANPNDGIARDARYNVEFNRLQAEVTAFARQSCEIANERIRNENESNPDKQKKQMEVRDYQVDACFEMVHGNRIINLPTGVGKTHIATHTMDWFLEKYPEKIAVFVVTTTTLVAQQADHFENYSRFPPETPLMPNGAASSEENIAANPKDGTLVVYRVQGGDSLDINLIKEQLAMGQRIIIVIIHDLLYTALNDADIENVQRLKLPRDLLSIVIFDECHHAIKEHPYARTLRECFEGMSDATKPRLAGLTASFTHARFYLPRVIKRRQQLEQLFSGTMWAKDFGDHGKDQRLEAVPFEEDSPENVATDEELEIALSTYCKPLFDIVPTLFPEDNGGHIATAKKKCGDVFTALGGVGWWDTLKRTKNGYWMRLSIEKERMDAKYQLALTSNTFTAEQLRELMLQKEHVDQRQLLWSEMCGQLQQIVREQTESRGGIKHPDCYFKPEKSGQLRALLDLLKRTDDELMDYKCIIFVKTRVVANALVSIVNYEMQGRFIVEGENAHIATRVHGRLKDDEKHRVVNDFREGRCKILIGTDMIEEGLDVGDCNVVISFDSFSNVKSHIQRKGRGRKYGAKVYFFGNDPDILDEEQRQLTEVALQASVGMSDPEKIAMGDFEFETQSKTLRISDAQKLFKQYVKDVTLDKVYPNHLFEVAEKKRTMVLRCKVPIPELPPMREHTPPTPEQILNLSPEEQKQIRMRNFHKETLQRVDCQYLALNAWEVDQKIPLSLPKSIANSRPDLHQSQSRFAYVMLLKLLVLGLVDDNFRATDLAKQTHEWPDEWERVRRPVFRAPETEPNVGRTPPRSTVTSTLQTSGISQAASATQPLAASAAAPAQPVDLPTFPSVATSMSTGSIPQNPIDTTSKVASQTAVCNFTIANNMPATTPPTSGLDDVRRHLPDGGSAKQVLNGYVGAIIKHVKPDSVVFTSVKNPQDEQSFCSSVKVDLGSHGQIVVDCSECCKGKKQSEQRVAALALPMVYKKGIELRMKMPCLLPPPTQTIISTPTVNQSVSSTTLPSTATPAAVTQESSIPSSSPQPSSIPHMTSLLSDLSLSDVTGPRSVPAPVSASASQEPQDALVEPSEGLVDFVMCYKDKRRPCSQRAYMTMGEIMHNPANIPQDLRGKDVLLKWMPPGKTSLCVLADPQATMKDLQITAGDDG